jgi:hypothetical protein
MGIGMGAGGFVPVPICSDLCPAASIPSHAGKAVAAARACNMMPVSAARNFRACQIRLQA